MDSGGSQRYNISEQFAPNLRRKFNLFNHNSFKRIVMGALSVGMWTTAANATVIIDNFSQTTFAYPPTPGVTRTTVGSTPIAETGLATANTLGGSRTSTLIGESFVAFPDDNVAYRISTIAQNATYSSTDGANGALRLFYDGGTGDLNADFSLESQLDIHFNAFDFGNAAPLPVTITPFDGINTASITKSLTGPGTQDLFFALSDFTDAAPGLDLTSINSIQFDFNPGLSNDFTFDLLQGTNQAPEPASMMLIGSGLAGLGLLVRRRKA